MQDILLVSHLLIAVALVTVVLMQRSEGGVLGIGGGGGGGGGFLTGRGTANLLTRTTAVLALAFFVTSISLSLLAQQGSGNRSILESGASPATQQQGSGQTGSGDGSQPSLLDDLKRGRLAPLPSAPAGGSQ
ncbi:MAG: preprotein translocase subunit SecG [Pseudomonadota bacterium]